MYYKYAGARTLDKFLEYIEKKEYLQNDKANTFEVPKKPEALEQLKQQAIEKKNELHRFLDRYIFKQVPWVKDQNDYIKYGALITPIVLLLTFVYSVLCAGPSVKVGKKEEGNQGKPSSSSRREKID